MAQRAGSCFEGAQDFGRLRANLAQETELFDQDQLGQKLLHFIVETAEMQAGNAIRKAYAR